MAGKPDSLKPETLAANALGWIDEKTGAIVPSIHRRHDLPVPQPFSFVARISLTSAGLALPWVCFMT